ALPIFIRRRPEGRDRASGGSQTVLVIDDSPTFREQLRATLESAGYAVLTAATGEEGLQLAAAIRPAAVVVDGLLPGIDGGTVVRRLRLDAGLRRTPCLLLAASGDRGDELRALDSGADDFVRKEEDASVILARLGAVLRSAGTSAGTEASPSLLDPKKILAVDDSPTYLEALASQVRHEGYDLVLARSGQEALELLAVQPVECILLDLVMPGLSGQEICRRIKSTPAWRDIPLIMLTALESFSYAVAHDLRAPLRAIHGFARLLVEEHASTLDADGQRLLGVVFDNARQMERLIDDLLALSRLGRKELESVAVDMAAVAWSVSQELQRAEPDRRVSVRVGDLPPTRGDRGMLQQVFVNLIGNALKFT